MRYNVDTRSCYFGKLRGVCSAVNMPTNGKHVRRSANRLARTTGIPAVRGGPEPTVGPSQLRKGCPFVAIFNYSQQRLHSAPFLVTFSSALIEGSSVIDPFHHKLSAVGGGGGRERDAAEVFMQGGGSIFSSSPL